MTFFTKSKKGISRQDLEKELDKVARERDEILNEYIKLSTLLNQTRRDLQSAEKEADIFRVGIVDIIKRNANQNAATTESQNQYDLPDVDCKFPVGGNEFSSMVQDDSLQDLQQTTDRNDVFYETDENFNFSPNCTLRDCRHTQSERPSTSQSDDDTSSRSNESVITYSQPLKSTPIICRTVKNRNRKDNSDLKPDSSAEYAVIKTS